MLQADEDISTATVPATSTKANPKRKENFCFYCQTTVTRLCEHLEKKHPNVPESKLLQEVTGTAKQKRLQKMKITLPIKKSGI